MLLYSNVHVFSTTCVQQLCQKTLLTLYRPGQGRRSKLRMLHQKVARASRKPPQCQIYSLKLWNRKTIRLVLKVLAHIPFTLQWLSMIRCPTIGGTFFPFILLRKKERKWKIPSKCSIEFCHQLWTHNLWSIRSFQREKFLLINILFLWITPYTLWL